MVTTATTVSNLPKDLLLRMIHSVSDSFLVLHWILPSSSSELIYLHQDCWIPAPQSFEKISLPYTAQRTVGDGALEIFVPYLTKPNPEGPQRSYDFMCTRQWS
jgi:hypothetical protein